MPESVRLPGCRDRLFRQCENGRMALEEELQKIYDSEIHVGIGWLWHGGIDVSIGNGEFTGNVQTVAEVLPWLQETIAKHYPESKYNVERKSGEFKPTRVNDSQSAYLHRSLAWLVGGFAGMALLLGVVGLYGVIEYSVNQRVREIGIRMALGAQPGSVYRLILGQAGWLTILGITVGFAGSVCAASLIRSLLFGVTSWDVMTLAGVAAILGIAALLASFLPARRAASVNPVEALRAE